MPVRLKSLRYWERKGKPQEWTLDGLTLGPVNLIVGRNATGKTRTMNVIWNLARFFFPEPKFRTANAGYDLLFDSDEGELRYILDMTEGKVIHEEVHLGGQILLFRRPEGDGEIFTKEENKNIRFKPPENELAVVVRRDLLQHWFLEPLHEWALGVRHYYFGRSTGQDILALSSNGGPDANDRDHNQVIPIFRKAEKEFGQAYVQAVIRDMADLNYNIEAIKAHASDDIKILRDGVPSAVLVLGVKEFGVAGFIDHVNLSQGMFRVLSILIQLNYSQMAGRANCILIDDIGEGLDFERSSRLIELLGQKAKQSQFQLIMTTNDQFVMNHVPLEYWSVLQRQNGNIRVRNYDNSRELFEEFKFIGLSNFSFLEMDFMNEPAQQEAVAAHE